MSSQENQIYKSVKKNYKPTISKSASLEKNFIIVKSPLKVKQKTDIYESTMKKLKRDGPERGMVGKMFDAIDFWSTEAHYNDHLLKDTMDHTGLIQRSIMIEALFKIIVRPRHQSLLPYIRRMSHYNAPANNPFKNEPMSAEDAIRALVKARNDNSRNVWEVYLDHFILEHLPIKIKFDDGQVSLQKDSQAVFNFMKSRTLRIKSFHDDCS
jgi:hypothetical protein